MCYSLNIRNREEYVKPFLKLFSLLDYPPATCYVPYMSKPSPFRESPTLVAIRSKLYSVDFTKVKATPGRSSSLSVDGVTVEIKTASGSGGKWRVNLHRHGKLDESGVDAYIIQLLNVPGAGRTPTYLTFPAPLGRKTFAFTVSSLMKLYGSRVEDWDLLRAIAKSRSVAA